MPFSNPDFPTTPGAGLTPAQVAQARHHSYHLFSQLYKGGATAVSLATLQAIPTLAAALPSPFDADEAAAIHYRLFEHALHPYESFFLDSSGLLGGPVTEAVTRHYAQIGFSAETDGIAADHIGQELAALAFLCAAEAQAHTRQDATAVARHRQQQADFLHQHLLPWLPPLVLATRQQAAGFYTAVADLTLALLADHAADLALPAPTFTLNPVPGWLAHDQASLGDIAQFWVTPVWSGLVLGREDVARLARQLNLPRGFGSRQQMMHNLLRTAGQYDQIPALLQSLAWLLETWAVSYRQQRQQQAALADHTAVWLARLDDAASLLQQLRLAGDFD